MAADGPRRGDGDADKVDITEALGQLADRYQSTMKKVGL